MGSRSITLTSLHDLIKQLGLVKGDNKSQDAAATYGPVCASSVIVEGKILSSWSQKVKNPYIFPKNLSISHQQDVYEKNEKCSNLKY